MDAEVFKIAEKHGKMSDDELKDILERGIVDMDDSLNRARSVGSKRRLKNNLNFFSTMYLRLTRDKHK